ncbi:MAG: type III PLP-dependent enzyme [Sphaerochaetaceae bacterium]|nr:type III PLP-dependent enzyme [Sphaerochaetaceae bacterium]
MEQLGILSAAQWQKVLSIGRTVETPVQIILQDIIEDKYKELEQALPFAKIYYAVKANPEREVLSLLDRLGANFDVASVYELRRLQELGIPASRMSCGNTIKKFADIAEFYAAGIRLFVTDSEGDLRTIAKAAPGVRVMVRLMTEGAQTADWPLSRKFGCSPDMAGDLVVLAKKLGLTPWGLSFHVGSQQRDIMAWDSALSKVSYLFSWLQENEGINLQCINMGGGFPATYQEKTNPLETYAKEITRFLQEDYDGALPEIIIEPGRSLVGNSGVLVSEIVLISRKSRTALERWIYQDCGRFGGLMETLGEAIHYPILCERSGPTEEVIIAGPTCDSMDTLYEDYRYELPLSLAVGDRLYWLSTGAYTSSYSAIEFNGFPPLRTLVL